jgi:hypothetical protein
MANSEQLEMLRQGAEVWNHWRSSHPKETVDLSEARLVDAVLSGMNLENVDLMGADLRSANLTEANLKGAKLHGANLQRARLLGVHLHDAILFGANLEKASLCSSKLVGANLQNAHLRGADLEGAVFRQSNLRNADLTGANLLRATFRDADLRDAILCETTGFQSGALGGADISNAVLPEVISGFHGLSRVDELSKSSGAPFVSMLLACAYAWLTIAITTDAQLLTNSISSKLPIIQTEIPLVAFYWLAPAILLGVYTYFHLYLQRLWEALSDLPAVFPDGITIDRKSHPWLMNDLVRAHFVRLRERPLPLFWLQKHMCILLAWCIVPLTLLLFWARYLSRHDWPGSVLHILVTTACAMAGILSYRLAVATLRRRSDAREYMKLGVVKPGDTDRKSWRKQGVCVLLHGLGTVGIGTVGIGGILYIVTYGAINGIPPNYISPPGAGTDHQRFMDRMKVVPKVFSLVSFQPFANLQEVDVSSKPPNWTGVEIPLVKGARLRGADL